jgi:hypothetical protein
MERIDLCKDSFEIGYISLEDKYRDLPATFSLLQSCIIPSPIHIVNLSQPCENVMAPGEDAVHHYVHEVYRSQCAVAQMPPTGPRVGQQYLQQLTENQHSPQPQHRQQQDSQQPNVHQRPPQPLYGQEHTQTMCSSSASWPAANAPPMRAALQSAQLLSLPRPSHHPHPFL